MMVLDWEDAFHTMGVLPNEFQHQVVKGFDGEYLGYETVLFGGAGSPGVWGRAAALLGRSGQSLFDAAEARIQVYVDDPWTVWRGTAEQRERNRVILLLWWLALGPPVSWRKVQLGRAVQWIGVKVSIQGDAFHVTLGEAFIEDLAKLVGETLASSSSTTAVVKKLAGKAEWAAGVVPYLKAIITPLWAAASDAPHGQVGRSRIQHTLRWLAAFLRRRRGTLTRVYAPGDAYPVQRLTLEFDASPWGYGGVLWLGGARHRYFTDGISEEDVVRFGIVIGDAKHQAFLEALAILIGVRAWKDFIGKRRWAVWIRSDSQAAPGAALKLRSTNPQMNEVIRELALDLAEGKYELDFFEHVPGVENKVPDFLSRITQPGAGQTYPPELDGVSETNVDVRGADWWESAGPPEHTREVPVLEGDLQHPGTVPILSEGRVQKPGCSRSRGAEVLNEIGSASDKSRGAAEVGVQKPGCGSQGAGGVAVTNPEELDARVGEPFDILRGGARHDVRTPAARHLVQGQVQRSIVTAIAPECKTFSRARGDRFLGPGFGPGLCGVRLTLLGCRRSGRRGARRTGRRSRGGTSSRTSPWTWCCASSGAAGCSS